MLNQTFIELFTFEKQTVEVLYQMLMQIKLSVNAKSLIIELNVY